MESPIRTNRPQIIPVYSEVAGISSFFISKLVNSLKYLIEDIDEWMPNPSTMLGASNSTIQQFSNCNLLPIHEAIANIHFPANSEKLTLARRRFAFEELFLISLRADIARNDSLKKKARSIEIDQVKIEDFIKNLPFTLTGDQQKAIDSILSDLQKLTPMNRLLNGDVGSGKTVVAVVATLATKLSGQKTCLMCPTTILANQHYGSFKKFFGDSNIGIVTSNKKENIEAPILVGTHALLNLADKFFDVGLVIVDEQHRFGVEQRARLNKIVCHSESQTKNLSVTIKDDRSLHPHFLSMTATPIPRTLRLALFGDLDISVISEMPANRKEIKTRFVEADNRTKAYEFIREHLRRGFQAFVICPLIEENKNSEFRSQNTATLFDEDRKSVMSEYEKLKKLFPEFEIGFLHGKMRAKEKEEIMAKFCQNEIKMLVSTSVVEVGVDVPNATIMMIEDAECFGLSQLHQFRGRVGRGEHQSFCFLFSISQSEKSMERLRGIENISDGFRLAELDLEMRGPGAIFGTEQSGLVDLKMASLSDTKLIEESSTFAKEIAPEIDHFPALKEKLNQFESSHHME
jgi:ATP-dependent DNA helicase RecG